MIERFSGSVKSTEVLEPSSERVTPVGLLLRPTDNWQTPITVGKKVKLILPDGSCCFSRVKGGEIMTKERPGMLVEFISEIDNTIPEGTRVYMLDD